MGRISERMCSDVRVYVLFAVAVRAIVRLPRTQSANQFNHPTAYRHPKGHLAAFLQIHSQSSQHSTTSQTPPAKHSCQSITTRRHQQHPTAYEYEMMASTITTTITRSTSPMIIPAATSCLRRGRRPRGRRFVHIRSIRLRLGCGCKTPTRNA